MKRKVVTTIAVVVNGRPWKRIFNLRNAGPDDRVFTFNREDGVITFGDGTHGRSPSVGASIGVSYRDGAGSAGNISKRIDAHSALTKFWVVVRPSQQAIGWGKRPC